MTYAEARIRLKDISNLLPHNNSYNPDCSFAGERARLDRAAFDTAIAALTLLEGADREWEIVWGGLHIKDVGEADAYGLKANLQGSYIQSRLVTPWRKEEAK